MKEHVETIKGSFVDFAGKEHKYVIAAVSQVLGDHFDCFEDYLTGETTCVYSTLTKSLSLGISICNPEDEYNDELGILKAVGRAKKSEPVIYTTKNGLINTKTVRALLEQESSFLKENPEKYIKGYEDAKKRYENNLLVTNLKNSFSELENKVIEEVQKNPKFLDKVKQYLKLIKK